MKKMRSLLDMSEKWQKRYLNEAFLVKKKSGK